MSETLIYVVDDHQASAQALAENLEDAGYTVRCFNAAPPALSALHQEEVAVVITDLRMDGMDGIALLRECRLLDTTLPVILVTAHATVQRAIEATQAGAFAFVTKPLHLQELLIQVRNAVALRQAGQAVNRMAGKEGPIIGNSSALLHAIARADRAAATDMTVLITGESGTGKELFARRIHRLSRRHKGPFVPISCGAIPDSLVEGELFGTAKGAYTGADRERQGVVEAANGGTLFLDEIGELSASAQVRLLRFLQEGNIRRLGETRDRSVDVRVVAATHQDLRHGSFRQDLYYRLAVIPLELPPLRARAEDVLLLFGIALRRACSQLGRPMPRLSNEVVGALRAWSWPGNVRELLNLADRIAALSSGDAVEMEDLPVEMGVSVHRPDVIALPTGDCDLTGWLEGLEEQVLRQALARHDGVKARAAESLGLERTALRYKLKKYGIEDP